jgi:hypothetical protein
MKPRPNCGEPTDASGSDLAAMASAALGVLEASGASLHVVMPRMAAAGPVLGDGSLHSGGSIENSEDRGLEHVRDTLLSQYALTYAVPRADRRENGLVVRTSREGVRLLAPSYSVP